MGIQENLMKEEIINGQIFAMSPLADIRHSMVINRLHIRIGMHLLDSLCEVHADNTYLYVNEQTRLIPDLMIVCDGSKNKYNGYHGVPKFIVEVLSKPTAKRDRTEKMQIYAELGIEEYWIVDYKAMSIEVYLLKERGYVLNDVHILELEDDQEEIMVSLYTFPNITINLKDIFSFVWN